MDSKRKDIYSTAINCNISCSNVVKKFQTEWIPRGFYCKNTQPIIDILVVGKNPGHPLEVEKREYRFKSNEILIETLEKVTEYIWINCPDIFHKRLLKYLAYFLNIQEFKYYDEFTITREIFEQVFSRIVKTELVKCSTKNEQEPLRKFKDAANNCFDNYLRKEILSFKPKNILCLGTEVYDFLSKRDLNTNIIKIKHPSYAYSKIKEKAILDDIKSKLEV